MAESEWMDEVLRRIARRRFLEQRKKEFEAMPQYDADNREEVTRLTYKLAEIPDARYDKGQPWSMDTEAGRRFWAGVQAMDDRREVGFDEFEPEMIRPYLQRFVDRGIPRPLTRESGEVIDPMDVKGRYKVTKPFVAQAAPEPPQGGGEVRTQLRNRKTDPWWWDWGRDYSDPLYDGRFRR